METINILSSLSRTPPWLPNNDEKSFIDKWNKLNNDVCAMEKEFADMAEQVKEGVA